MTVEIQKIPPLQCAECKSKNVNKSAGRLTCFDCKKTYLPNGKTKNLNTFSFGKGHNPRVDTGDYLE